MIGGRRQLARVGVDTGRAADSARLDLVGTAHAVHVARSRSWTVLTSDPDTVLSLAPDVRTETIP